MSDIRKQIQEQMSKIPDAVKNGSVQQVIRWKERCNEAQRIVNNSKATQHQLEQALRSLK
jgi:capsule polysaccharide export protein KpsE/RkpR